MLAIFAIFLLFFVNQIFANDIIKLIKMRNSMVGVGVGVYLCIVQ